MPRKRYTAEQIITTLRQAEVEIARGQAVAEVCRKLGTSEQTYYRWRKEYGGLRVNHLKRLKALELENRRLRTVVADRYCQVKQNRAARPPTCLVHDRTRTHHLGGQSAEFR